MDRRVEDGHPVKRPHDASIFFNWFEQEDDDIYLQEELKNIWNDPLSYYKVIRFLSPFFIETIVLIIRIVIMRRTKNKVMRKYKVAYTFHT
jgi:hypothetical protein